jgi:hypothetical protein
MNENLYMLITITITMPEHLENIHKLCNIGFDNSDNTTGKFWKYMKSAKIVHKKV